MKSLMMAIFLSSVSIGNFFTAFVNQKIQIEVPSEDEISEVISIEDQDKIKKLLTDEADKIKVAIPITSSLENFQRVLEK